VIVGDHEKAQELSRRLYQDENIFAQAFSYPVVPKGKDRIRTIVNAHHTREQLDYVLASLERIGKSLQII
jgi:glycine C-acetyltransferase